MSQLEVDKIIPQSGTTLTIGDSGDTISFADGATLAIDTNTLAIDSTNNRVGIGTSSPDYILDVKGDIRVGVYQAPRVILMDTSYENSSFAIKSNNGNFSIDSVNSSGTFQASPLVIETTSSEAMRIDSSGNVGIGTSSPDNKLHIQNGDASASSNSFSNLTVESSSSYNILQFLSPNTASQQLRFGDPQDDGAGYIQFNHSDNSMSFGSPTERMRITGDGAHLLLGGTADVNEITETSSNAGMVIGNTSVGNGGLAIITGTTGAGRIYFGDATGSDAGRNRGQINYYHNGDFMLFATAGTERMRIDSSGNVGIGTSSPQKTLHVIDEGAVNSKHVVLRVENSNTGDSPVGLEFITNRSSSAGSTKIYGQPEDSSGTASIQYLGANHYFRNQGDTSTYMTIDSSGKVIIGEEPTGASTNGFSSNGGSQTSSTDSTATRTAYAFRNPNGQVGSITTNGSSTAFNTSSDYRLKENVVDMTGATERLKQLQPKKFNFIADADTTVDGFLAHEVSSIVPEAITGIHNEVQVWEESEELPKGVSVGDNKLDDEGNTIPVYQGIDQSKLVPLLVATIKELEARITALET